MSRNVSNEEIAAMLRQRSGEPDDVARADILRLVATMPQATSSRATGRPLVRALILVTLLAAVAIGGAVILGFRPKPPPETTLQPASLSYSDGCRVVSLDASDLTGDLPRREAMVPLLSGPCSWPISYDLSWSADGRLLAYSTAGFFCGGCGSERAQQAMRDSGMWVLDTDTGTRSQFRPMCESPICGYGAVVISPDGGSLAFVSAGRYWVLNIATNRTIDLGAAPRVPASGAIAWSPDSARLAVIEDGTKLSVISADGAARAAVFDAGVDREVPPDPARRVRDPAWSPDGRRLIFVITGSSGGIRTIRVDGSDLSSIGTASGLAAHPTWSPDGQLIAYLERGRDGGIWVMSSDGSGARALYSDTAGSDFSAPVWAPGGGHVAFARRDGLYLASLSGNSRRLESRPQFSEAFRYNPVPPAWQSTSATGGPE